MIHSYSAPRRLLHWFSAILIMGLAAIGLYMVELPNSTPQEVAEKLDLYSWHKTLGIAALVLGGLRLYVSVAGQRPAPLPTHSAMEVFLSRAIQTFFVLALISLPLSGLAKHLLSSGNAPIWLWPIDGVIKMEANPEMAEMAGTLHYVFAYGLLVALFFHVAGALKHHLIDRDPTLRRMISHTATEPPPPSPGHEMATRAGIAGGIAIVLMCTGAAVTSLPHVDDHGEVAAAAMTKVEPSAPQAGILHWRTDYAKSVLELEVLQQGKPFKARFDAFKTVIHLDPDKPESGRISVEVDLSSFNSGSQDRDREARGTTWLAIDQYATARFESGEIKRLKDGGYQADGTLSLKGVERPVALTFSLARDGNRAVATGNTVINRTNFNVGSGQWAKDPTVGFEIKLSFHVVATTG